MNYEVEQKFPVSDMAALEAGLTELGATVRDAQLEVDLYFAHPGRNFAETDEALRIRRRRAPCCLTYKGPKIDRTTKTRREIELSLGRSESSAADLQELLEALGFTPVGEVRKSRRKAAVDWNGRTVEASLDEVQRLGTFAELELVTDAGGVEEAKAHIAALAETLGLRNSERRSYLELLLE